MRSEAQLKQVVVDDFDLVAVAIEHVGGVVAGVVPGAFTG
jgi:hypothetical protein